VIDVQEFIKSTNSADTVISAAHCFTKQNQKDLLFVAGKTNFLKPEPGEALSLAKSIVVHPGYTSKFGVNDVAIIKLKVPLCFNKYIQPIPLTQPGVVPTGKFSMSNQK